MFCRLMLSLMAEIDALLKSKNSPKAVLFFLWLSKVQIERRGTQGFRGIAVKPCKIGRR